MSVRRHPYIPYFSHTRPQLEMYGCFGTFTDRSPHTAITPRRCKPVGNASERLYQLEYSMYVYDLQSGPSFLTDTIMRLQPYTYGAQMRPYTNMRGANAATVSRSLRSVKPVPRSLPSPQALGRARGRWPAAGASLFLHVREQRPR